MNEIIFIQVGQCGNRIGAYFWETVASEHGIDAMGHYAGNNVNQTKCIESFFRNAGGKYIPRCVFVATEPGVTDEIKGGPQGTLFSPENYVVGDSGCGNNWAKGHYSEGALLLGQVMQRIAAEVEQCKSLDGFILCHSLGGGDGSGLGTLILKKLKEKYPNKTTASFSVLPSPHVSDAVNEPYNAALCLKYLSKYADLVFCLDNEAVYEICNKTLKISSPTYGDINHLVSAAMSGVTAPLRLPKPDGTCETLSGMAKKLAPNPRLRFLSVQLAPLTPRSGAEYRILNIHDLAQQVIDDNNKLSTGETRKATILAYQAVFRGKLENNDVNIAMADIKAKCPGIKACAPDNSMVNVCEIAQRGLRISATLITNSSSITDSLTRISSAFAQLYRRQAFTGWYTGEGMEKSEFDEANDNLSGLIREYSPV